MQAELVLSVVLAVCAFCVNSSTVPRIKLHRNGDGRWYFARGGETLPLNIGWNHFHRFTEPCPDQDVECRKANLFEKMYHSNASAAALGELPRFYDLAFTGSGYDDTPPEHMTKLPFLHSMFLFSANQWRSDPQFDDPWDPQILMRVDKTINQSCARVYPYRENVLGYIFNDALAYNVSNSQKIHGKDWVSTLRCLSRSSLGHQQYLAYLNKRYGGDLNSLCAAYMLGKATCKSWSSLDLCAVKNTEVLAIMHDDEAFIPILAEQIFSHVASTLKLCDPDAILLGDNFNADAPLSVIEIMAKHADAITVQLSLDNFERTILPVLHDAFESMPIVVADMGFAFPHSPYEHYEWPLFESQAAAGKAYRDFVVGAAKSGYVVSINKCGYIDRVVAQPHVALKAGLVDFNGSMHEPITSLIRETNRVAQQLHRPEPIAV